MLVVGLPLDEDNNNMKERIKHFISLIDFQGEIQWQNEDFSSFEAKELSKGIFKHKKDGRIDSLSAYIILDRFLFAKKIVKY
jgi:putative Holliday junction resolvase